jgi:hypothetical protein
VDDFEYIIIKIIIIIILLISVIAPQSIFKYGLSESHQSKNIYNNSNKNGKRMIIHKIIGPISLVFFLASSRRHSLTSETREGIIKTSETSEHTKDRVMFGF